MVTMFQTCFLFSIFFLPVLALSIHGLVLICPKISRLFFTFFFLFVSLFLQIQFHNVLLWVVTFALVFEEFQQVENGTYLIIYGIYRDCEQRSMSEKQDITGGIFFVKVIRGKVIKDYENQNKKCIIGGL